VQNVHNDPSTTKSIFAPHHDRHPTPMNVNTNLDSKFVDHPPPMKNETLTVKTYFLQFFYLCLLQIKDHAACDVDCVTKYPMRASEN
jgi:hypothetical protein